MTFLIRKTSDYDDNNKPCKNATVMEEGRNEYGWKYILWKVEIESLEDLMQLIVETKNPLVIFGEDDKSIPLIEIYDDYRE